MFHIQENSPGNASLYINSHFTKYLSEDEIQELDQYKEKLTQFKSDVKAFLEQRQKQALEQRGQFGRQGQFGAGARGSGDAELEAKPTTQPPARQPEPPKKPSFCNDKATTQFVFDGCSVQVAADTIALVRIKQS